MGYVPLLSLSAPSLFGLPFQGRVALLKRCGFSGIELFMFPHATKHLRTYQAITRDAGMRLSLHQPWSYKEGGLLLNRILNAAGYLPKDGYLLLPLIERGEGELFIAYCDRFEEVQRLSQCPHSVRIAFQTACAWNVDGASRTHRIKYCEFVEKILPSQAPIVFDTFHVLEWRLSSVGGKALASYNEDDLASELLAAWHEIGPTRVVEIHWNDFIANYGHKGVDGRACLPGDGILAKGLRCLAEELQRDDWRGPIVPELSPFLLFPYGERKLTQVRERMEKFFT